MTDKKASARDYVENYVKEGHSHEDYLSQQQPHYDPKKAPSQTADASTTVPTPLPTPAPSATDRFKFHMPTFNPIPEGESKSNSEKPVNPNHSKAQWSVSEFMGQKQDIHEAAQENCVDIHEELFLCFKNGSWIDRVTMCESQKRKFWDCYHYQKKFLESVNYKGAGTTAEENERNLYTAMRLNPEEAKETK
ncbi:hypothetical protein BDF14DRAFT_1791093 [Spinellus fusiger]|nr:hypothetical protein BDF14DRAFT_1791093 [Spinellus fusiger]